MKYIRQHINLEILSKLVDEHRGALLIPRMLQLLSLLVAPSLALEEVASASYLALPAATKASRIWTNCLSDTSPAAWLPALQVHPPLPYPTTPFPILPYPTL